MKRIKTLLILVLVVALVVLVSGCGMLGSRSAGVDTGSSSIDELPQWLTLAHRAEAAEEPEVAEEEEATEEEAAEAPAQTATTQPATTQPATTQPATTQPATQQPAQTGKPLWQQPGTMEYIAKMRLDELVNEYRRLKNRSKSELSASDKSRLAILSRDIPEVAKGLGIDLKQYYGIDTAGADSSMSSGSWFHDTDSPSGWGN